MGGMFSSNSNGSSNGTRSKPVMSTALVPYKQNSPNPLQRLSDFTFGNLLFGESPKHAPEIFGIKVNEGDPQNGIGPTWRNAEHPDSLISTFKEADDPELQKVETMWEAFQYSVKNTPNYPLHGRQMPKNGNPDEREWEWMTYKEVSDRVDHFASGLEALNLLQPDIENRMRVIGIMGINCAEWVVAEYAAFRQGATTQPMYNTLDLESLEYVLNLTGVNAVVASIAAAKKIVQVKSKCPRLKTVIIFGDTPHDFDQTATQSDEAAKAVVPKDLFQDGKKVNLEIMSFQEVERIGRKKLVDPKPPKPSDYFTFVFTSGTTGPPKGALITHSSMITNAASILFEINKADETRLLPGEEVELSYLPLAHAMERMVQACFLIISGRVGFARGDPKLILEDLASLRPTFFPSVPRLLNRLADKIQAGAKAAGGLKAKLFQAAVDSKMANLEKGYLKHPLWDRLVFKKITKKLGLDRVKVVPTGSAPISGYTLNFLRVLLGAAVFEGYGQSELTCIASGTHPWHFSHSHVGPPSICAEIRLESVPDMDYLVTDTKHGKEGQEIEVIGRGEVCVRGPCVMQEYYRQKEKTAETISNDGWLRTGDIGAFLPNGTLKIIDRKKNIFKLSQGEYVEPEKIENNIVRSNYIAQAFVHSTTMHSFLVAVLVPDVDTVLPWAKKEGLPNPDSIEEVVKDPRTVELLQDDMNRTCRANGMRGFEIPRKIHLEPEPFDPSNILTPTFKMARNKAQKKYEKVLEDMLGPPS